jgi:hypothetical protein
MPKLPLRLGFTTGNGSRYNMEKKKIPTKVYKSVGVGFFFSLIIIWYFSYRLLTPTLVQFFSHEICVYSTLIFSFTVCLFLINPSIEKELEKVNEDFSLVARNPNYEIVKEDLSVKSIINKTLIGISISFVFSLPITIMIFLQIINSQSRWTTSIVLMFNKYWLFYLICILLSLIIIFFIFPSLKKWHWTKHQF